ncbi:uncharacterized protein LOC133832491 [Humulus lupulus]|uniref:uncharacterized protein LOC133832491 n=1 Tax=Humulus lupulus TaxID=3486 RepID=UPI002B415208|nr:uncharacterized protein LOC133832491 [Humulus lupulus]
MEANKFVLGGFKNWKIVNDGIIVLSYDIGFIEKQTYEQIENNRLRLQVTIDVVKWLALQACAFRGRDESKESINWRNFHEFLKLLASYNDKVASVVQENAPLNATYTLPTIQKEILYIFSNKVKKEIRQEIGDSKFCIIVDEALDVSKREQMTLVLRFVDKEGFIRERYFGVVHRNDELKEAQSVELATKITNDEIKSGTGLNQIGTLKRAGDTRWSSHLDSISSLLKMFNATCVVLSKIAKEKVSYSQRGDADFACNQLLSFELPKSIRDSGWDSFLMKVTSFCEQHQVDIPDLDAQYVARGGRSRNQQDKINLQELNSRFNEHLVELLVLSTAFDPRDGFKLFKIDDICKLAENFYPDDFSEQEVVRLRIELQHFVLDIPSHPELQNLSSIHELCQGLVKTRKAIMYPLIDRLLRLVLTLPVSTATTVRTFSIMKIIKTKL